jgi:hypothetical protein
MLSKMTLEISKIPPSSLDILDAQHTNMHKMGHRVTKANVGLNPII